MSKLTIEANPITPEQRMIIWMLKNIFDSVGIYTNTCLRKPLNANYITDPNIKEVKKDYSFQFTNLNVMDFQISNIYGGIYIKNNYYFSSFDDIEVFLSRTIRQEHIPGTTNIMKTIKYYKLYNIFYMLDSYFFLDILTANDNELLKNAYETIFSAIKSFGSIVDYKKNPRVAYFQLWCLNYLNLANRLLQANSSQTKSPTNYPNIDTESIISQAKLMPNTCAIDSQAVNLLIMRAYYSFGNLDNKDNFNKFTKDLKWVYNNYRKDYYYNYKPTEAMLLGYYLWLSNVKDASYKKVQKITNILTTSEETNPYVMNRLAHMNFDSIKSYNDCLYPKVETLRKTNKKNN